MHGFANPARFLRIARWLTVEGLIAGNWLAISVALVLSTVLTLVVTVLTFRVVARRTRKP